MINIENFEVMGWEHAIRGMRNSMNSWDKSDSDYLFKAPNGTPCIGGNDLKLMMTLRNSGTDHRKFMRMITVYMDITAPLYWWSEYDTYKVGTVANSCSKMHKLLHKPFEMNDFSFDKLPGYRNEVKQFRPWVNKETEIWKQYDSDYDVSNQGRIRHGYRILSGSLHKDGYIFVTLHGAQKPLHRVIASVFLPNMDETKNEINHKDGNKQNNFIDNLEWVSRSENQKHAVDSGLQPKGLSTYKGKFTPEQRQQIKQSWDDGRRNYKQLAAYYNVSTTCIRDIVNDKYKYIDKVNVFEEVARPIIDVLNELRDSWFLCDDEEDKKKIWYSIIQLLPNSYNQKRTVMLNYEVLANIYKSRKNHKLDEWREFCKWIEELPYSELITGVLNGDDAK